MHHIKPTIKEYQTLIAHLVRVLQDAQQTPAERVTGCLDWIDRVGCWPEEMLCPSCGALGVPCDLCDVPETMQRLEVWGKAVMRGEAHLLDPDEYLPSFLWREALDDDDATDIP